ncbi:MAG TPA: efflux RND transporter periplasmic adaptor subunit [Polyangiaceae bacterium]|nr:efflux RND transporter periplasmic adaptor subunit [Polyangiaceae bacterium]
MRQKKTRAWLFAVLTGVMLLILAGVIASTRAQTTQVVAGSVNDRIVARAVVVAEGGIAEVRARTDGRVLRVLVREGDTVEVGQLLAEIEGEALAAELARVEAERSAAAASAKSMAEGARLEERLALEAEVRAARKDLELAEDRAARLKKLREIGGGTEVDEKEAVHAVDVTKARLEAAEARLKLAKAGGRTTDVRALEARVAAAEAAIAAAKTGLASTRITAPIAGVVLARRADPGDTLTMGSASTSPPLFEIADTSHTEVRVEVEEADAMRVAAGVPVTLTMPGGGNVVAKGRVARIGARLERRTIGVEDARVRADAQVRAVWVEGAAAGLPIGQRMEAVLELSPRPVQAMVPRSAVRVRDGRAVVEVPWGPLTRNVPVKLGAADDQNVELFGVEVGTKVVVSR